MTLAILPTFPVLAVLAQEGHFRRPRAGAVAVVVALLPVVEGVDVDAAAPRLTAQLSSRRLIF
jgi:hypothetical protein